MANNEPSPKTRAEKRMSQNMEMKVLREQIEAAHAQIKALGDLAAERLKEIEALRAAARQLLAGLQEYAKEDSWRSESEGWVWAGEGNGPNRARYFLGLEQENN